MNLIDYIFVCAKLKMSCSSTNKLNHLSEHRSHKAERGKNLSPSVILKMDSLI